MMKWPTLLACVGVSVGAAEFGLLAADVQDAALPASPAMAVTPPLAFEQTLAMPLPGWQGLRVLAPAVLELTRITTKASGQPVTDWDFAGKDFRPQPPPPTAFVVAVNGTPVAVTSVGFKRRPLHAPLAKRNLIIRNDLYLVLEKPVPDGAAVRVASPAGLLGPDRVATATADPLRWSPALHANQVGYDPALPKKAKVGYYLGTLGELGVPSHRFQIVNIAGKRVYEGELKPRPDQGFPYKVPPYQQVLEADFSPLRTPGEYRLAVPGLGASFPFRIDDGVLAAFARTYALGLYHQRCGTELALPFTRFTHSACHTAPAEIPTMAFTQVQRTLSASSPDFKKNPPHAAPQLKDVESCLYPFVRQGMIDVHGGHHDAGDYSKYTINSAQFIHYLVFAADAFPGVAALDNLGLPESGDGKSDLLQIAKWEADFLARMQDDDGGFFFLVYPKNRKYEGDVLPESGDPQVVFPKTTAVTAAAVAALAQASSSPRFREQFPREAALYLEKAKRGWGFLERAWTKFGRDGAYQKITHYGNQFMDRDEIAWAATEMFLATGEKKYQDLLIADFDPADPKTFQWGWVRLSEGYGCAIRSYAFGATTGRIKPGKLDPLMLRKCREQILDAAADAARWADASAYGTSFPFESKKFKVAGWYFPVSESFPLITGLQLEDHPEWLDAFVSNLNFEAGGNPNNVTFITGLGWRRQREIVHQYAQNDSRVLPPDGIPLGAIQAGFAYLDPYKKELSALTYPWDGDADNPYPFYDRWGDSFNTTTEFVAVTQARSLGALAFLMARTPLKNQPWRSAQSRITGLPNTVVAGTRVTAHLEVKDMDLHTAQHIVWEARDQEPAFGPEFSFTPAHSGVQQVEAEAQWPDGRRVFATARILALKRDGGEPHAPGSALLYQDFNQLPTNAKLSGTPRLTEENLGWMRAPAGKTVRFNGAEDAVELPIMIAPEANAITLSAWLYIEQWPWGQYSGPVFQCGIPGGGTILGLTVDKWRRPTAPRLFGAGAQLATAELLAEKITLREWLFCELSIKSGTCTISLDGTPVCCAPVDNAQLAQMLKSSQQAVVIGHFTGYADDLRLEVASFPAAPVSPLPSPSGSRAK